MATVQVKASHLTNDGVTESIQRADDSGEPISDACAVTIASWFQSSGSDGEHFAALASGCAVDSADVLENIGHARRHVVPGLPPVRDGRLTAGESDATVQLDRLQEWLETHG